VPLTQVNLELRTVKQCRNVENGRHHTVLQASRCVGREVLLRCSRCFLQSSLLQVTISSSIGLTRQHTVPVKLFSCCNVRSLTVSLLIWPWTRALSRSRRAADKMVVPLPPTLAVRRAGTLPPFGPGPARNVPTVVLHYMSRQKLLKIQTCKKCRAATRLVMIRSQFYLLVTNSNTGVYLYLPLIHWSGGERRLRPMVCISCMPVSFGSCSASNSCNKRALRTHFFSRWCGAKLQTKLIVTTCRW